MNRETFDLLVWAWIAIGVAAFVLLQFVAAPYGRHAGEGWGPRVPNRAGWVVMEATVLFSLAATFLALGGRVDELSTAAGAMVVLFAVHYVNRSFIYPLRTRTKGKTIPLATVAASIAFNAVNGFFLGHWFARFADYPDDWLTDPRFLAGLALFVGGMALNWQSDQILIHLRAPGETGYKVPRGGAFRWVSSPNLLGEIIEWAGFAIMAWCLPAVAFVVWTLANLVPRAIRNHRWYHDKFPGYPPERRALVPYLF